MPPSVAALSLLLFVGAIVGLATGTFDFSLGSVVIWGALLLLSLALLSRWFADANVVGLLLSCVYTVLFVIWLVRTVL